MIWSLLLAKLAGAGGQIETDQFAPRATMRPKGTTTLPGVIFAGDAAAASAARANLVQGDQAMALAARPHPCKKRRRDEERSGMRISFLQQTLPGRRTALIRRPASGPRQVLAAAGVDLHNLAFGQIFGHLHDQPGFQRGGLGAARR